MLSQVALVNMLVFFLCIVDKDVADGGFERYSRIRHWKDIGPGDIKIFLGHLIAMGLVGKNKMEKYRSQNKTNIHLSLASTCQEIHSKVYYQTFIWLTSTHVTKIRIHCTK